MEFINTGLDERILKSMDAEHPTEYLVKAMNRSGLVQKKIVDKNGHTTTRWVKASEAQSGTQGTKSSDDSKDTKKKSDKFYKDKYFDQFGNLNITEALKELSRLKYKLVAASEKDANHNRQGYQYVFYNGIDYVTIYRNGGNSNETEKIKVSKTIPSEPKYNFKSYDKVHYPMNNDTAVASTFSHVKNAGLFVQQSESKKDTIDKDILDSKLNPHGYKVGDYLKVRQGHSYTTYQVKSLEKSKDISGREHVYLNCIEIMKNGQVYDFNHLIIADSKLISYKIDEPLTLKNPSGKRSKDNSQQSAGGQKPSAKNNEIKFDKTKSGKVGGIQIGNELATVVKTAPTGAKKLREVTDKDTGKTYSIYTDVNSNKPDGIVAIENNTQNEQKPSAGQKLSPADAKKKTQEITNGVSDKKSFMEKAKAQGITWKENDHEGINWMRCCMAMNKHFENGGDFDNSNTNKGSSNKTDFSQVSDENDRHNKERVSSDKVKWEVEKRLKDMFYDIPNVKSFRRDDGSISLSFDMDDADGKMMSGSTLKKFMKESDMNFDNYDVTATRRKKTGFSSSRSYGYEFSLSITPKSHK